MIDLSVTTQVGLAGFGLGGLFGAVAQRTHFCTMGAISDIVAMGNWQRMRTWLLAMAVAILATQAMAGFGLIDLSAAIYLTPNFGWLGAILGGLLFGFGMTLAGGCANKTLVRFGGGNLKSLVVLLVMGLFAYMTLRGLTGLARVWMEGVFNLDLRRFGLSGQGIPEMLAAGLGLPAALARWVLAVGLDGGLLAFCLSDRAFRRSLPHLGGGMAVGLLVAAGWAATGILGNDDFSPTPLASMSFVAPIGDSLQYLMTFSGATINFGIASVGGVIAGAFLAAVTGGTFRIEAFTDQTDMIRQLTGAAMMGVGGVLALGCTIGQGLTGVSTLAAGSVLATLSILAGGVAGLRHLE